MINFEDFRTRNFPEQIQILNQVQEDRNDSAIPFLFDLLKNPLNDTMVDHLVKTSLQSLLSLNEAEVLKRIESSEAQIAKVCINSAAINGFKSALPSLHKLLDDENNSALFGEALIALAKIKAPESLVYFRRFIAHTDELIAATCIEMLGVLKDEASADLLISIINDSELDSQFEVCSIQAGAAVEALASLKTDKVMSYLVSKIHHKNATIRRRIQDEMIKIGPDIIPYLSTVFADDNKDRKILAANILGFIGNRKGGEILVQAIDTGKADDPNVRYAIYEAFGRIPFLKGLMCLVDALKKEDDELILLSVVTALNEQVNPGVLATVTEISAAGDLKSKRLIKTIASSRATNIFKGLYENESVASLIISQVNESRDPEALSAFREVIESTGGERAAHYIELLSLEAEIKSSKSLLAVDDSKAMLSFYRSIASELGYRIQTATNGKEALEVLESGEDFDLIITDMNMPIMDGIEFSKQLRNLIVFADTPVIMVTTESEQSQRTLAEKAGVNFFVTKPFTIENIKEKISLIPGLSG